MSVLESLCKPITIILKSGLYDVIKPTAQFYSLIFFTDKGFILQNRPQLEKTKKTYAGALGHLFSLIEETSWHTNHRALMPRKSECKSSGKNEEIHRLKNKTTAGETRGSVSEALGVTVVFCIAYGGRMVLSNDADFTH
jgi:hypothetical protein